MHMKGQKRLRVLIADRQSAVRSAVRLLLEEKLGSDVVGEAADNEELLAQLERLRPDIILLDWDLPGLSTGELSDALHRLDRRPGLIVMRAHRESVQAALATGADAFVNKGDPPRRLLTAIRALSVEGQRE
jgi:DNA-binding NarL/FixJ family response regulator